MIIVKHQEEMNLLRKLENLYFGGPWDKENMKIFHEIIQQLEHSLREYQVSEAKGIVFQSEEFDNVCMSLAAYNLASTEKH
ncbi:MAG: hypothetical protein WCV59_03570 [Parcubacteria group bacterium]|jgi:hypothetical protein